MLGETDVSKSLPECWRPLPAGYSLLGAGLRPSLTENMLLRFTPRSGDMARGLWLQVIDRSFPIPVSQWLSSVQDLKYKLPMSSVRNHHRRVCVILLYNRAISSINNLSSMKGCANVFCQ